MKRILFDTNVVLDVLFDRKPHAEASASAWATVETGLAEGIAQGLLSAHAVTTIHYLIQKELGSVKAKRIISGILQVFGVAAVDGAVIQTALQLHFSDFEDAVTAAAAQLAGCDSIVTRDPKGFRGSPVRPLTPEALQPYFSQ